MNKKIKIEMTCGVDNWVAKLLLYNINARSNYEASNYHDEFNQIRRLMQGGHN